jgi:hypothetical protein
MILGMNAGLEYPDGADANTVCAVLVFSIATAANIIVGHKNVASPHGHV